MSKWLSLALALVFFSNAIYVSYTAQADFAVYLSYFLAFILAGYCYFYKKIQQFAAPLRLLVKLARIGFLAWLTSFAMFCLYLSQISAPSTAYAQIQTILVFGGGIENNQPNPALKLRLERALSLAKQVVHVPIIVSGGQASTSDLSEAEVMQHYLINRGINKTRIYLEANSTSTQTNLSYSQQVLKNLGLNQQSAVAFVSSDFHLARISAIAKQQGYANFILIAASTPRDLVFNAYLREYFAYISGFVLKEY